MVGGTILEHFSQVTDPRMDRTKVHQLTDIIMIAICAIMCGANSWVEVEVFGKKRRAWLETFLELPNDIPSHDTFGRVFAMIDAEEFSQSFVSWVRTIAQLTEGDIVAIDGKTNRRSYDRTIGKDAIHLVSAFVAKNGMTLAQRATDTKSNELKAIPKLLNLLDISGCTVTIDAAGCYPEVVDSIVEHEANYVIAVKQNQPTLYTEIAQLFTQHPTTTSSACTEEQQHGRLERRECWVINKEKKLQQLHHAERWKQLRSVAKVTSTRTVDGITTTTDRYYISSLSSGHAKQMLSAIRQHWAIENTLHWVLDIVFREDDSRIRIKNAQENFALLRKLTLNVLKQDTTVKAGIKVKRFHAALDPDYLLKLLDI